MVGRVFAADMSNVNLTEILDRKLSRSPKWMKPLTAIRNFQKMILVIKYKRLPQELKKSTGMQSLLRNYMLFRESILEKISVISM